MQFIYFTKTLREHSIEQMAEFITHVGLDGADLAVRPGYPVHPDNVAKELPAAVRLLAGRSLRIPLLTAPTNMNDPNHPMAKRLFAAAGDNGISAIKLGYFHYRGDYRRQLAAARKAMAGFARLAETYKVRACYHTHSGSNIGSNAAGLLDLLRDLDPHHVGAFLDTGHQAVGGAPIAMAIDMIAPYLSLISIKDMAWTRDEKGQWGRHVVPAPTGIVKWHEFAKAIHRFNYNGPVSLHAEYHPETMQERRRIVSEETKFLRKLLKA